MTDCCMAAKKARKWAIHFLKDIFRDTTQRKENAFYTNLRARKTTHVEKSFAPRVGDGAAALGAAALYLYSSREVRAQRTFLWEAPEIQADVFCALHQPEK